MTDDRQTQRDRSNRGEPDGPSARPTANDSAEGADQADMAEMTSQMQSMEEELGQMKDRALRVQAELENYRKRVAREAEEQRRYADMGLLREILPVLDNMERAIEAAEKSGEAPGLLEGFRMVVTQLTGVLERHHCTPIEALNRPFDPNLHEAISQMPSNDHPPNTVMHVVQTGYVLHDRVVRPSQVIVSAPAT